MSGNNRGGFRSGPTLYVRVPSNPCDKSKHVRLILVFQVPAGVAVKRPTNPD